MSDLKKQYLITIAIGLAVAIIFASGWGIFDVEGPAECMRILSDSFAVPGVMMVAASLLIWVSSKGGYDAITYSFNYVKKMFTPKAKLNESYYDYKMSREEKRLKTKFSVLWVGLGFIGVSIIFTLIFHCFYVPPVV